MDYPPVSIIIPTYNRAEIVRKCILGLRMNLYYQGDINYYIGIDGNDNTFEVLNDLELDYQMELHMHTKSSGSLGANINRLIKASKDNYFLQMDDDHILQKSLDLSSHIEAMENNEQIGYIRLWGIAGHRYAATLKANYWHVSWQSRELYIPSFRPHLKSRKFHEVYGMIPEGKTLGETENSWCGQCKEVGLDRLHKWGAELSVCVPVHLEDNLFDHIGESWQSKGK